jgi:hypothetical protein
MSQAWKYYTLQLKSTISVYFIGKVRLRRSGAIRKRKHGTAALYAPAVPAHLLEQRSYSK